MSTGLLGGDERCAHPHAGGARRERGGKPTARRDAARGEHWHDGADRVEHVEQQRPQRAPTVESTAPFAPTHHQQVDPGIDGPSCILDRADLPGDCYPMRLRPPDELRIGAGMVEVDQAAPFGRDRHGRRVGHQRHQEVHSQRSDVGQRIELLGHRAGRLQRKGRHAHRSRPDDGADQRTCADATHRCQLHRDTAADQLGESCRTHRSQRFTAAPMTQVRAESA